MKEYLILNKVKKMDAPGSLALLKDYQGSNLQSLQLHLLKRGISVNISALSKAEHEVDIMLDTHQKHEIDYITVQQYPDKLKKLKGFPSVLYYKGNIDLLNKDICALIGTRTPTKRGMAITENLADVLSKRNVIVLNGIARGCDTIALQTVVNNKKTAIAVMPCGLDIIYPSSNKRLADDIIKNNGCIISEYQAGEAPQKYKFVERDKIQAGLSDRLIVVEADINSGTMHTADFGYKYDKPVACYIENNNAAEGNVYLVKNGKAVGLTENKDLENFLNSESERQMSFEDYFSSK